MASPKPYSGKDTDSSAYVTIKDQLPTILNKAMDCFLRSTATTSDLDEEHAKRAEEEKKDIIGKFSKLRYEIQTDKVLQGFPDETPELSLWNKQIAEFAKELDAVTWFSAPWLFVECLMYRKMKYFFETSVSFKEFDPFEEQKKTAMTSSLKSAAALSDYLNTLNGKSITKEDLITFLEMALWGNKCDLALTSGVQDMNALSYVEDLANMRPKILCNDIPKIVDFLWNMKEKSDGFKFALILDNAGFELFTDLCLLEILTRGGVLNQNSQVELYVKKLPWFISDTLTKDFHWHIDFFTSNQESASLRELGTKWATNVKDNRWKLVERDFWTVGYEYSRMQELDPSLYEELSKKDLVMFKGDLNYRKLVADLHWSIVTPFEVALRGFHPTSLCSLRTIKADVVVGLESEALVADLPKEWTRSGTFAVVHFLPK